MTSVRTGSRSRNLRALALSAALATAGMMSPALADTGSRTFGIPRFDQLAPATLPNVKTMGPAEIYRKALPAIAHVFVDYRNNQGFALSMGTAWLVEGATGDLVTNAHVVDTSDATGPVTIQVEFADDHTRMQAQVVGRDTLGDIAVLHVSGDVSKRQALRFAQPTYAIGDDVIAIGYPKGTGDDPSLSRGVISAMHRFSDYLQTDAAINPGNSGGPLLDMRGEVIGVVTFVQGIKAKDVLSAIKQVSENNADAIIANPQGIGLARGAQTARRYVEQISTSGEVERADLGFEVLPVLENFVPLLPRLGVLVKSVKPGSAAERSGLKVGEIVYAVDLDDGTTRGLDSEETFQDILGFVQLGRQLRIHGYILSPEGTEAAKTGRIVPASEISWYYSDVMLSAPAPKSASR
jgi:S1-C subfamily serine protease